MGIAYVAGLGEDVHQLEEGMRVIVNGSAGTVQLDPSEDALRAARQEIRRLANQRSTQRKNAHQRAQTLDGFAVEVAANVGNEKDTQLALANGADGVGLLRSEFLFLHRRNAPSEAEQRKEYEGIARLLGKERSLVLRTLDVGGDKPLSYMPLPEEENPFLGVRGLRLSLQFPDLFRLQIRAALAAAEHTKLNLMFPMVSQLDEFKRAKAMALEEVDRRTSELDVAIGIMVEVPSAALNASWLAKEADFFSIGTNDLTQYTLAMDRGHPELSKQADAFDPAVLRLIAMTVEAAHAEGKWVGVCGGLAAEPLAAPLLVGLRLDELSVPAPAIPELKARICSLRQRDCLALAEGALAMPSASRVRALLQDFLTLDPRP
jgi:phosphocarrier protein FPr/phosphocarrier protein